MSNPYWGCNFFSFFVVFCIRLWGIISGSVSFSGLVEDEIQVFSFLGISLTASFIGVFVVLRKMVMFANALSHTLLLGIVLAFLLLGVSNSGDGGYWFLFYVSLFGGGGTVFLTHILNQRLGIERSASIGLAFTLLFALGVIGASYYTYSLELSLEAIMGNADMLSAQDLKTILGLLCITVLILLSFFRGLRMSAFDPVFAQLVGCSPSFYNFLIMCLTALVTTVAFNAVGVVLFLSFLVGPVVSVYFWARSVQELLWGALFISVVVSGCTVAISRHMVTMYQMPVSTAGLGSVFISVICLVSALIKIIQNHSSGITSLSNTIKGRMSTMEGDQSNPRV